MVSRCMNNVPFLRYSWFFSAVLSGMNHACCATGVDLVHMFPVGGMITVAARNGLLDSLEAFLVPTN